MSSSPINPATTDTGVSSDNCVTTTLSNQMTLAEYTNAMNYAFAIKNSFQSDFDPRIISDEQHNFLLSVAMRAIFKLSTA